MPRKYKMISADSHVNEPPDLWQKRVAARFKDRAPRMQRFEKGDAWILEGARDPINIHVGLTAAPAADHVRSLVSGEFRHLDAPVRALEFIYTGVFDRFPKLQLVFAEVDCGWVPYVKQQIDRVSSRGFKKNQYHAQRNGAYYFDTNLSFVYINDPVGITVRHLIGVDRILWSTDHAHSASHWPNTQDFLRELLADVPEDEKYKMLADNAMRLYGIAGS